MRNRSAWRKAGGLPEARRQGPTARMIVDMHTHAGRGPGGGAAWNPVPATLAGMAPAGVAAAVVAAIPDATVIRRNPASRRIEQVREPRPGECWATTLAHLEAITATAPRLAREPAEIRPGDPAVVLAVEGCDGLEGGLDRLDTLAARGVRSMQFVHYRVNETGDIQTAPEAHGGLTPFGADAVRRMNTLGIIPDVAHCTEATAKGVCDASARPVLCTHANLQDASGHPRFISPDYARRIAETGGVVGAWIAVLWDRPWESFIDHLFRLVDAVGVAHVGIGTDMPVGVAETAMPDFARHADIPAALAARGLAAEEIAAICGGNWLRVFRETRPT